MLNKRNIIKTFKLQSPADNIRWSVVQAMRFYNWRAFISSSGVDSIYLKPKTTNNYLVTSTIAAFCTDSNTSRRCLHYGQAIQIQLNQTC